jgi:ABC-2 type transport system permease protein
VRSLMIVIVMPVAMVLLFGYGINLDLKGLPVYVFDQEGSQQSQDLLKHFQASKYFHLVRVSTGYPEVTRALDDGHAKMGIVIPWDFSQRLRDGGPVEVQALVDASDDNTANVPIGYAQAVVQGYSAEMQVNWLGARGLSVQPVPVSVETRTWYNEDLESSVFIIPGVLEIMLGKLTPYFVLGILDTVVGAAIAIFWFHVPFRGSFVTLLAASAMFMVVVLSLGYFISVIAKSQFAACQIALIVAFLPAFLLSGFLFPIEQMPVALQWITRIFPARYYVSVLKKIFLKGTPAAMLNADLIPLAVFTVILALLATCSFHKRLD